MTTALLVFSHCDDEILAGLPFITDRDTTRKVLIVSSDKTNPLRQSYRRGEEALAAVCADLGVAAHRVLSDFHSEFSRLRTRGPGDGPILMDWWNAAVSAVREMSVGCDFIACDGPHGFYGNLDHLLTRRMVLSSEVRLPIRWTTLRYKTNTWPIGDTQRLLDEINAGCVGTFVENCDEFMRLRNNYISRQCWTWDHCHDLSCDIYEQFG